MRRLLLALPVLLLASATATADGPPRLQPPVVETLTIDGNLDDEAWKNALELFADSVDVPDCVGEEPTRAMRPTLRAVVHAGQLCLAASGAEPPGTGCGLLVFVARMDADSAGHAWSLSYRPLNPRCNEYIVRTAKGVGHAHCPLVGAIDIAKPDRWSLELRVPLADVGAKPADDLRLAAVVCTRTPSLVAASPARSAWRGPKQWYVLEAPEGGWRNDNVPDAEVLAAAARKEQERDRAWTRFLQRTHDPLDPLPTAVDGALADAAKTVVAMRKNLGPPVHTILGDLHERVGAFEAAAGYYERALAAAPGWSEARFGRDVRLRARRLLAGSGTDGATTDYEAAYARVAAGRKDADAWARHGWDLAEGLLRLRAGEFAAAKPLLQRVAERFPGEEWPRLRLERMQKEGEPFALERMWRKREADKRLPRVQLETSRGNVVVELFEKEAATAVDQFVWLVERGFYDGTRVHHAAAFSHAALGDPFSKDEATMSKAGAGGPGYEVRVAASKRRPYRGSIAFPLRKQNVRNVGSQFVLLTGMAISADGLATFGTVVDGQAVVDALRAGDVIKRITVLHKTAGRAYRPLGLDGQPVPEPK